ncbi:MAG: hypothetical protein AAF806_06640 [Bacteroidota bacterium]
MNKLSTLKDILIGKWNFSQYYPETHILLVKNREKLGSFTFKVDEFKCRPYNESDAQVFGENVESGIEFAGLWDIKDDNILSLTFDSNNWQGKIGIHEKDTYILIEIVKASVKF